MRASVRDNGLDGGLGDGPGDRPGDGPRNGPGASARSVSRVYPPFARRALWILRGIRMDSHRPKPVANRRESEPSSNTASSRRHKARRTVQQSDGDGRKRTDDGERSGRATLHRAKRRRATFPRRATHPRHATHRRRRAIRPRRRAIRHHRRRVPAPPEPRSKPRRQESPLL
jgi:hypothetical protein